MAKAYLGAARKRGDDGAIEAAVARRVSDHRKMVTKRVARRPAHQVAPRLHRRRLRLLELACNVELRLAAVERDADRLARA